MTAILTATSLLATSVTAQYIGPGSTVAGDYMRGFGIAAVGMGEYNVLTARADQLETETAIQLDAYVRMVVENENRARTESRAATRAHRMTMYNDIQERVLEHPAPVDLKKGNAHNAIMRQLNAGSDSAMKHSPVILPTDVVRSLPFMLNKEGAVFSMPRLLHKGKAPWPVVFQRDRFNSERFTYDRAMGNALDEQLEGKLSPERMDAVLKAIESLERSLDDEIPNVADKLHVQGSSHLRELRAAYEGLKSHNIQKAMMELDTYTGTTVYDLRKFMWNHELTFAEPIRDEEKQTFRVLYDALVEQREITEGIERGRN
jgi:hypothetical protein